MKHNFHILSLSVYPYLFYFYIRGLFTSVVIIFKYGGVFFFYFFIALVVLIFVWFKDIIYESLTGHHRIFVQDGFKYGMLLFIFREFIFFFCIFWVFFDSSLVLIVDSGDTWDSLGYIFVNPLGVPLLNSFILLRSAATVT
jgi:hypothetical protein